MKMISKLATAGAVAVMGLGLGAAGASANIDLSPNPFAFTGEQSSLNSFTAGSAVVECEGATFAGNTANVITNSPSDNRIPFHAEYGGCTVDFGLIQPSATVVTNSDWELDYVSGDATSGVTANVNLLSPGGSTPAVTINVAGICTISIPAQSGLSHVVAENSTADTSVDINATVEDIQYSASGLCPGVGDGTDGTYGGTVNIPDITITDVP